MLATTPPLCSEAFDGGVVNGCGIGSICFGVEEIVNVFGKD